MFQGGSIYNLLRCVRGSARTLLAIETLDGDCLGCFTSSPWRGGMGRNYYGSGEAFVWRLKRSRLTPCGSVAEQIALESDVQVYPWTGKNRNVQFTIPDEILAVGGGPADGDGDSENKENLFAIALDADLQRGTSGESVTFDNPGPLSPDDVFEISNIEVWTLSPVDDIEQAEKIELSRQFVFDHGNFVE